MRLTKKRADNGRYYLSGLVEVSNTYPKGYGWIQVGHAVEKLAEYEDLEEQGKLLKLPCKAGQKVFLLRKDIKSVIDGEITSIRIGEFASEIKIFIIDDNRYTDASFDKIGDIVFFTREEAEAALKELGERKNETD